MSSFIENVNKIALKLEHIVAASDLFDEDVLPILEEISVLNLDEITQDLQKGNYLGNRKIDIQLDLNNNSETDHVSYSKAEITLTDGSFLDIPFDNGSGGVLELTSHADIKEYITNHSLYLMHVDYTEATVEEPIGSNSAFIRFRDSDGYASNIDKIALVAYAGDFKDSKPYYFWAKTTSALETLANRTGDIIRLGNDIDKIITLAARIDEVLGVQTNLTELLEVHAKLTELTDIFNSLSEILQADENAAIATQKAAEATAARDDIHSITADAITTAPDEQAQAIYNPSTGKFTFAIPQGKTGDKGEAFQINAQGDLADRGLYDDRQKGFSFLAIDESMVYFKLSDTAADWSSGSPFGKGDKGDTGATGNGIVGIQKISTSGNIDTYEVTYTNGDKFQYTVANASIDDTTPSSTTTYSSQKIDEILGDFSHSNTLGDVVIEADTNAALVNPVSFNSLTVQDGAILKLI